MGSAEKKFNGITVSCSCLARITHLLSCLLSSVKPEHYLYTMDFLDAIGEQFEREWKA